MIKTNFLFAVLLISTSAYAEVISVNSSGSCKELDIGSQKAVSISTLQSSSRVEHNYTLVRLGKTEFQVYLRYDFDFQVTAHT
jgi:tRNA A37 N6-isopentenylltransferase MiaA